LSEDEKEDAERRRGETPLDGAGKAASRLGLPGQSLLVGLAAVLKQKTNQKEVAKLSGFEYRKVNKFFNGVIGRADPTEQLLRAFECRPAEVRILWSCLEAWSELDTEHFTDAQLEWVEREVAEAARQHRRKLKLMLRGGPSLSGPPAERDWLAERLDAEELRKGLQNFDAEEKIAIVRTIPRYQTWSFAVVCADWSLKEVSKSVEAAIEWAELGCLAAERVQDDPSGLTSGKVQGYCRSHLANAVRVLGELSRSEEEMQRAVELWEAGADPLGVLDPGRVPELVASLRLSQRRPAEALRLLVQAAPISRRPAHVALKHATALTDLGEYEEAEAMLIEAGRMIEILGEPRLKNVQQYSLCEVWVHLGRHREAAEILPEIQRSVKSLGDELDSCRARWLEGRIARGLGEPERALEALEAAAGGLDRHKMLYDVALARFEVATLHLEMGKTALAAEIAGELAQRFASCGDFEEAKRALELFAEATTEERATSELACAILKYLYLAQNQELAFQWAF
jgi:tetratricopeptide (TPR) repeat protein